MRDNLKKMVDGAEAFLQLLGNILFYVAMSPFFVIIWAIAIVKILYNYSKNPSVTFEECVRYNFSRRSLVKIQPGTFNHGRSLWTLIRGTYSSRWLLQESV